MSHILVVDDEPSICWAFQELLTEEGHRVIVAPSAEEAIGVTETNPPQVVMLDVRLPGMDGLSAIREIRARAGDVPIIVMTAFGNLDTAVRAVQEGAFEYLVKPFDLDQAAEVIRRALRRGGPVPPAGSPDSDLAPDQDAIIGSSPAMQAVFKQIALAAPSDVPVLISGESGTGKELVARALHRHSSRSDGPFAPICLAALSPTIIESELFGHVRGAFTGADSDRKGLLEQADGGTVFLDEIGDVPQHIQVKLLRAIEQGEVTPVGDARARRTRIRIIAASHRSLPDLIAEGRFREDLYYRLAVFRIEIPPLRKRIEDIPALARHFLKLIRTPGAATSLSDAALRELMSRSWFGNVRELRNAVEHASIVSRGGEIDVEALPQPVPLKQSNSVNPGDRLRRETRQWVVSRFESAAERELYPDLLKIVETELITEVFRRCHANRAAAARVLGMHRATLRQKLRTLGIGSELG